MFKTLYRCARTAARQGWARILRTTSLSISMLNAKAICCAIRGQPQLGLRSHFDDRVNELCARPFRAGLPSTIR
jgi:hypothetical protein